MTHANKYLILIFITFSFAVFGVSYLLIHSRLFMENPDILSTEISMLYYGLFAWKRPKQPLENAFTAYKKSGYGSIVGALAFLSLTEVLAFHVFFMQISIIAAWIIFALNLYGIIFILADFNATRREPTFIEDEKLYINAGIRWKAVIPVKDIKSVELSNESSRGKQILRTMTILSGPNLVIVLEKTHRADGPYGIRKNFDKILLNLDEPQRFKQLLGNFGL
jgi:L-lactate permease